LQSQVPVPLKLGRFKRQWGEWNHKGRKDFDTGRDAKILSSVTELPKPSVLDESILEHIQKNRQSLDYPRRRVSLQVSLMDN